MTANCMTVVLGTQWGDEGKGKVVDRLAGRSAAVCRYQGGHNAGHTLISERGSLVLHLIPAGALHPHVQLGIGQGAVVSLPDLLRELDDLLAHGVDIADRLMIDPRCHLVLPGHCSLDQKSESHRAKSGGQVLGTTGKGIGPTYEDRVARRGVRFGDLADEKLLAERLRSLVERHNFLLSQRYDDAELDWREQYDALLGYGQRVLPMMCDVPVQLMRHWAAGEQVILEGAQGYLLDVDKGSYPFVTSSNTCAANALPGAGLPPSLPLRVLGLCKAYNTRVGGGPFPTELLNEQGEDLRRQGGERGATTGRPRRCGWLDAVLLRRAAQHNALAGLVVTKLDVFDGWPEIRIATDYEQGCHGTDWHHDVDAIEWRTLPGWSDGQVAGCTERRQLPANAVRYLETLEEVTGVPVVAVSTGPERDAWVELADPLNLQLSAADMAQRYAAQH